MPSHYSLWAVVLTMVSSVQPSVIAGNDFDTASAAKWVTEHGVAPIQYLAQKFDKYDIVLLGEEHRVRQFPQFVADCIPVLYERGVRVLAMEFEYSINQLLIDSLLALPWLDNELLYQIKRRAGGDNFALFKEYLDIFRECWRFNQSLPEDAALFRIVALDFSSDEPSYLADGGKSARDAHMFQVLDREVISKGKKALVYCGWMHAMSELIPPKVVNGRPSDTEKRIRLGNHLWQCCRERAFSIFFYAGHLYTPDSIIADLSLVVPVGGLIEEVMARLDNRPLGFDIAPSPFAALSSEGTYFRFMKKNWTLADVSNGMLFLGPISAWKPVGIEDIFLNDSTFHLVEVEALRNYRPENYLKGLVQDAENTVRHLKTEAYDNLTGAGR